MSRCDTGPFTARAHREVEMIELAFLALLATILFAVAMAGLVLLKVVVWIVLLPFRLLFGLLILPLLLVKALAGAVALILMGPILLVTLLAGAVAAAVALLVPLLPLIVVGALIWFLVRASQRPAIAG
jgi:hypothetical protein